MSNHNGALELIDEKITELEVDLNTAKAQVANAEENLRRKQQDVQLVETSLRNWRASREVLIQDAALAVGEPS